MFFNQQGPPPPNRGQAAQPGQVAAPQPQPITTNPIITLGVTGQLIQMAGQQIGGGIGNIVWRMGGQIQTMGSNPLLMRFFGEEIQEVLNTLHTGYLFMRSLTMSSLNNITNQLSTIANLLQSQVALTSNLLYVSQTQTALLQNFADPASIMQAGFYGFSMPANLGLMYIQKYGQFIAPGVMMAGNVASGITLAMTGNVYLSGLAKSVGTSILTRYMMAPFLVQQAYAGRMGGVLESASEFAMRTLGAVGAASPQEFSGALYLANQWHYGRFTSGMLGPEIAQIISEFRALARELRTSVTATMNIASGLDRLGLTRPQIYQTLSATYTRALGGTLEDWFAAYQGAAGVLGRYGVSPQFATVMPALAGLVAPSNPAARASIAQNIALATMLAGGAHVARFGPLALAAGAQNAGYIGTITAGAGLYGQLGIGAPMVSSAIQQFTNPMAMSQMLLSGFDFYTRAIYGSTGPVELISYLTYMGMPFRQAVEVAMAYQNMPLMNFLRYQQQSGQVLASLGLTVPQPGFANRLFGGLFEFLAEHRGLAHAFSGVISPITATLQTVGVPALEIGFVLYGMRKGLRTLEDFFGVGPKMSTRALAYRYAMRRLEAQEAMEAAFEYLLRGENPPEHLMRRTLATRLTPLERRLAASKEFTRYLLETEYLTAGKSYQEAYATLSRLYRGARKEQFAANILRTLGRFGEGLATLGYMAARAPILGDVLYGAWEMGGVAVGALSRFAGPGLNQLLARYFRTAAAITLPWAIHSGVTAMVEEMNPELGPFASAVNQNIIFMLAGQAFLEVLSGNYGFGRASLAAAALAAGPLIIGREGTSGIIPAIGTALMAAEAHGNIGRTLMKDYYTSLAARAAQTAQAMSGRRWVGGIGVRTMAGVSRMFSWLAAHPAATNYALAAAAVARGTLGRAPGTIGTVLDWIATIGMGAAMAPIPPQFKAFGLAAAFAGYGLNAVLGGISRLTGWGQERELNVILEAASPAVQARYLSPEVLERLAARTRNASMREMYSQLADIMAGEALSAGSLTELRQTLEASQGLAEYLRMLYEYQDKPAYQRKRAVRMTANMLKGLVRSVMDVDKLKLEDRTSAIYTVYSVLERTAGEDMAKEIVSEMGYSTEIYKIENIKSGVMKDLITMLQNKRKNLDYRTIRHLASKYGVSEALLLEEATRIGLQPQISITELAKLAPEWLATKRGREMLRSRAREVAEEVERLTGVEFGERVTSTTLLSTIEAAISAGVGNRERLEALRAEIQTLQSLGFANEINTIEITSYEQGLVQVSQALRDVAKIVKEIKERGS